MPDDIKLPIPNENDEQRKFVDIYTKISMILGEFIYKINELKEDVGPIRDLGPIFTQQLRNAGIKLSDAESLLGVKLLEIKQNNESWKDESSKLVDALKSLSNKFWGLIIVITLAVGANVFNVVQTNKNSVAIVDHYHMPSNTEWTYDADKGLLWTIADNDTLYKKP